MRAANTLGSLQSDTTERPSRVVADEQQTIDFYFRSDLIKQRLNAAGFVDDPSSGAIGKVRVSRLEKAVRSNRPRQSVLLRRPDLCVACIDLYRK